MRNEEGVDLLFLFLRRKSNLNSKKKTSGGRQGRGHAPHKVPRLRAADCRARLLPPADGPGRGGGAGKITFGLEASIAFLRLFPFQSHHPPALLPPFQNSRSNSSPAPPSPTRATRPVPTPWGSRRESSPTQGAPPTRSRPGAAPRRRSAPSLTSPGPRKQAWHAIDGVVSVRYGGGWGLPT